jgi:hypothetical protein
MNSRERLPNRREQLTRHESPPSGADATPPPEGYGLLGSLSAFRSGSEGA